MKRNLILIQVIIMAIFLCSLGPVKLMTLSANLLQIFRIDLDRMLDRDVLA